MRVSSAWPECIILTVTLTLHVLGKCMALC